MRHIFTIVMLFVSMMIFTGCDMHSIRHNYNTVIENVETIDYVYRTEFEGHTYIMFRHNGKTNVHNVTGVIHDPDCKCFNK